ncbi:MAG: hypothetical protein ACR652_24595 [Methylocystis sp.]|uniref:hypothetical protein n=1 Tax=Methylocystis sp. TaxID=1911079 RepID=UPI003DA5F2A6
MTTDEKKFSERDLILAKREAFKNGAAWMKGEVVYGSAPNGGWADAANERYPMPKAIKPRVITANGTNYRVVDGWLEEQSACISPAPAWKRVGGLPYYNDGLTRLADLILDPTREVSEAE